MMADDDLTSGERAELRRLRAESEERRIEDVATKAAHKEVQTLRDELNELRTRLDARVPDDDDDDDDEDDETAPAGREPEEPTAPVEPDEAPVRSHPLNRKIGGR